MKIAVELNIRKTIMGYLYLASEDYSHLSNYEIVEANSLEDIIEGKTKYINGVLDNTYDYDSEYLSMLEERKTQSSINALRSKRDNILLAFDKYKSNIYYGIESETAREHTEMLEYYNKLLAMDEEAINNVPSRIAYYM